MHFTMVGHNYYKVSFESKFPCCIGKARKESSLNADQKLQRITSPPTVLEYFCYVFNFHSLLAGPSCTIHEFLAFMDGSNLQPMDNPNAYALVRH
jgi:hypothetical protein